jgi:putative NADH-flavin reductase
MKIVLFGASGRFGQIILEQALDAGHIVTAFMRSPSKVKIDNPNLILFQGDATDAGAVEKAISGQDAVVSALGPSRPPEPHMMETAAKNIVAGMKKYGVTRLVSTAGAGVRQPEDEPKFIDRFMMALLNLLVKEVLLDVMENVKVIQDSNLDWTITRFPRLTDGEHTGRYRVGYVDKDSSAQITRADGADFVLKELVEKKWRRKLPLISY